MSQQFKLLPIQVLNRGAYQPRESFDAGELEALAQSIRSEGLIEPLIVRRMPDECYEIIAGERRWRAAMLAELTELPCLVRECTDEEAARVALIENIQRQDLNLIEEARGYQRLLTEFNFTQETLSTLVGKSRSHIANLVRLLSLSPAVQALIREKTLSLGHARVLVGLAPPMQLALAQNALAKNQSVRQLEKAVQQIKASETHTPQECPDLDTERLKIQLAEQLGAPVDFLSHSTEGGWLKIKYFDNETLSGLLERLGLRYD